MSNQIHESINLTESFQGDKKIQELQEQLAQAQATIEQQKQQNKQLREQMILKEQINTQLSNFHLTSYFQDKEHKTISNQKDEELTKAQEHIMILGHMLLKNKKTIQRLKKSKAKDDTVNHQLAELIKEKDFLWDIIIKAHEEITQTKHIESDLKTEKANELLCLIKKHKKTKLKP